VSPSAGSCPTDEVAEGEQVIKSSLASEAKNSREIDSSLA